MREEMTIDKVEIVSHTLGEKTKMDQKRDKSMHWEEHSDSLSQISDNSPPIIF